MGKSIMLVDDSRLQYVQIKKILESTNYTLAAYCQTGDEAVAQVGKIKPDLILLDIIMPGIDGLETAHILKEEHPEVKIIMLSSLDIEDAYKEASRLGAEAFVPKPIDPNALLNAINNAL